MEGGASDGKTEVLRREWGGLERRNQDLDVWRQCLREVRRHRLVRLDGGDLRAEVEKTTCGDTCARTDLDRPAPRTQGTACNEEVIELRWVARTAEVIAIGVLAVQDAALTWFQPSSRATPIAARIVALVFRCHRAQSLAPVSPCAISRADVN